MAYIIDKETKQFWKYVGQGTTSDIALAFMYPENIAAVICRIMEGECYYIEPVINQDDPEKSHWVEKHWGPQAKNSPHRTTKMVEKRLVWVAFEGMWMATDQQALLLGTLAAYNMPPLSGTPTRKKFPKPSLVLEGEPEGPTVA